MLGAYIHCYDSFFLCSLGMGNNPHIVIQDQFIFLLFSASRLGVVFSGCFDINVILIGGMCVLL